MEMDSALNVARGKKATKVKTVEDTYQKLSQLEHILLRPDTYIGSAEKSTQQLWLWDDGRSCMIQREASFVPGLYKIFDEILVNAADHKQRDPSMDRIEVDIDEENNRISIYNNGNGIPVEIHKKEGVYVPELIFGHLLTSSNYNDSEKKVVGGRNGYGAKLANIFSTEFVVETADQSTKRKYSQMFRKNMTDKGEPTVKENALKKNEQWTRISFRPDLSRFGLSHLEHDVVALMKKRVYDIAGCTPGVKVFLNGDKLPIRNFKDYVSLYFKERPEVTLIHEIAGERWEVIITPSEGQFDNISFVNSIWTMKGGTHVGHVADQVAAKVVDFVTKKHKGLKVKPFQVKNQMCLFIKCLIENPSFDSQTKENMTSRPSSFGSKCELSEDVYKKVFKSDIIENLLTFAKFKQTNELKKTDGGKQRRILGIPKLDDANMAGTKDSSKCTLILTEGDSAKSLAVSGFSVVGRDQYGVFPLRGKLLNVREASHKQIMENAEVNNLKKILGLQHGKSYDPMSVKTLRYGRVLIMTDQDHDGSHIKGLLINFFQHFWPTLMQLPHFLGEFVTPIVKCIKGKTELTFFTIPEYKEWLQTLNGDHKGWKIKYYKGLGTSTSVEAKDYFSNLDRHVIEFKFDGPSDFDSIDLAFSKQKVQQRKEWLASFEEGTFFDHRYDELTYANFVNKELILFSIADNERSIPNMMDGLKPSQRKVLFACFKRKLRAEIKVAQLAGYVSEHAAYHHGEVSLMSTIVGLAQNFIGSNNINLLFPGGQFGTRLQGGKDAASARYIFTKLTKLSRLLFRTEDDAILDYLDDDGLSIEPKFYAPVVPTLLVNGADGIGTGWSSSVPSYNPRVLIQQLLSLLNGRDADELEEPEPWFRRHRGVVRRTGPSSYEVHGEVRKVNEKTFVVTELPARTWTTPYKEWLDSVTIGGSNTDSKEAPFLSEVRDSGTENIVKFTLVMSEEEMAKTEEIGVYKRLRLTSTIATSNLVMFDAERRLRRYETAKEVLLEFYELRLGLYEKRRLYLLKLLKEDVEVLENKVRFILMVVDGKLKVAKRKKKDIIAELYRLNFRPYLKATKIGSSGTVVSTVDNEEDAEDDEVNDEESGDVEVGAKGYDYLLSMPLWSLTMERVNHLLGERDHKVEEMKAMEQKTAKNLYQTDLQELSDGLDELDREAEEEAKSLEKASRAALAGSRKKKTQKTGGRKAKDGAVMEWDLLREEEIGELVALPDVKMKAVKRTALLKAGARDTGSSLTAPFSSSASSSREVKSKQVKTVMELKKAKVKASTTVVPSFFGRKTAVEENSAQPLEDEADMVEREEVSDREQGSDDDFELSLTERLARKMKIGQGPTKTFGNKTKPNVMAAAAIPPSKATVKRGRQSKPAVVLTPSPLGKTPEAKRTRVVQTRKKPSRLVVESSEESANESEEEVSVDIVSDEDGEEVFEVDDKNARDPTPRAPSRRSRRAPVTYREEVITLVDDDEEEDNEDDDSAGCSDFIDDDSDN